MDADQNYQEQEIIGLLSKLKSATPEYPRDKLGNRRAAFLASIPLAALGGTVATHIAAKSAEGFFKSIAAQTDKIILAVQLIIVTGLASYVGVTAYEHRDELKNLLFPPPAATSVITEPPPVVETATPQGTVTITATPTGTLALNEQLDPQATDVTGVATVAQPPTVLPPTIPPQPTEPPPTDRPGLHLGQTKTPQP